MRNKFLFAITVLVSTPLAAQEQSSAAIVSLDKDRSGQRHANRWQIRCNQVGQTWSTGELRRQTRKMFINSGDASLRVGVGSRPTLITPGTGNNPSSWLDFRPGEQRDFGQPASLHVVCKSTGQFYAHAEWNRTARLFDF